MESNTPTPASTHLQWQESVPVPPKPSAFHIMSKLRPAYALDPNEELYAQIIQKGLSSVGQSTSKRVVVIGAGMAGLTAAHELQKV
jgi:NADPH-dependent 2,4-dienoyl-CoA reductase/sulfur reductase-like enzyme